ncbi:MAG: hypothetical protein V1875_01065 [Candidatus Altiarchaeota archaeon]
MGHRTDAQIKPQPHVLPSVALPDVWGHGDAASNANKYHSSLIHYTAFSLACLIKFCSDLRAANPKEDVLFVGNGGNGRPQAQLLQKDLEALGFWVDVAARIRSKAYDIAKIQSAPVPLEGGKEMVEYVLKRSPIVILADNSKGRVASAMYGYRELVNGLNILHGKEALFDPGRRAGLNSSLLSRFSGSGQHPAFKGYKRFLFWDPLDYLDPIKSDARISSGSRVREGDIVAVNLHPSFGHSGLLDKPGSEALRGLVGNLSERDLMPFELDSLDGQEVIENLKSADGRRLIEYYKRLL